MKHLEAITSQILLPEKGLDNFVNHFWGSRWNTGIQASISSHSTASTNTEQ